MDIQADLWLVQPEQHYVGPTRWDADTGDLYLIRDPAGDPDDPENPGRANPYFFLLQPSAFQQAAVIAGYAIDELGWTRPRATLTMGGVITAVKAPWAA